MVDINTKCTLSIKISVGAVKTPCQRCNGHFLCGFSNHPCDHFTSLKKLFKLEKPFEKWV